MALPGSRSPADELTLHRLAYDEARRRLDAQEQSLDELRSRAGVLIAASTIVTTFLGGSAASSAGALTLVTLLAIAAFVASVGLAGWTLLPRDGWAFYFGTTKLLEE